jgi:hypothetical protein
MINGLIAARILWHHPDRARRAHIAENIRQPQMFAQNRSSTTHSKGLINNLPLL